MLRSKLPVGDYAPLGDWSTIVDTKKDIQEAVGNICGKEHERFRRECELAQNNGIQLVILIADEYVRSIDSLEKWVNPRSKIMKRIRLADGTWKRVPKYPRCTSGMTLARAMRTMEFKYGVQFKFCKAKDQGKEVLKILGVE